MGSPALNRFGAGDDVVETAPPRKDYDRRARSDEPRRETVAALDELDRLWSIKGLRASPFHRSGPPSWLGWISEVSMSHDAEGRVIPVVNRHHPLWRARGWPRPK